MFYYLRLMGRYWWVLLLITAITTGSSVYLNLYYIPKEYNASTTLYILKRVGGIDKSALRATDKDTIYQDLLASEMLVKDFKEIVKSGIILQKVREDLKNEFPELENMSLVKMSQNINVTVKTGTRLVIVKVTDQNPKTAAKIANTIATVFKAKSIELLETDNVTIIDEATIPSAPDKPKPLRDSVLGGIGGFLAGIVLILFIEYIRKQKENDDRLPRHRARQR